MGAMSVFINVLMSFGPENLENGVSKIPESCHAVKGDVSTISFSPQSSAPQSPKVRCLIPQGIII